MVSRELLPLPTHWAPSPVLSCPRHSDTAGLLSRLSQMLGGNAQVCADRHTCINTQACMCPCVHTCIARHIQAHMSVWPCVFICPHKYKSVHVQHTHVKVRTKMYIFTCTHTHVCACTHVQTPVHVAHARTCMCISCTPLHMRACVSVCIQMCPSQPLCRLPICKLLDNDDSVNSERRNTSRGNTPPTDDGPIQALGIA